MKRLLLVALLTTACSAGPPTRPAEEPASPTDWSRFGARNGAVTTESHRGVVEEPIGATGIPYIRSLKLAWTRDATVPTFEPGNATRELPPDALQAVLRIDFKTPPPDSRIRVEWFYGETLAFRDEMGASRSGPHDFSLVMRERGALVPLPPGHYRADVLDGPELLKSIPFEVVKSR